MKSRFSLYFTSLAMALGVTSAHGADGANQLTVAGGIGLGSRYSGSDQQVTAPVIAIDYAAANGTFASTQRGLGYGGSRGQFHYSAALAYRAARSEEDQSGFSRSGSKELRGMGDVKASATASLGLGYALFDGLDVNLRAELPVSARQNGRALTFGVAGRLYRHGGDTLSANVAAELGDRKYAQTYYGVTALQSVRSGFRPFQPKAGLYRANASLNWQHVLASNWALNTAIGVTTLLGDAADSPLARRRSTPTAALYVSRSY
jgi:outer membrane scaffolding protein for murein synthesis (MipA/OmpV family)